MSEPVFSSPPDIELLQWLAQGSLKQNLLRAIRLWVWLRSLYGDETIRVNLPQIWSYANWRDTFFCSTHPKGEKVPTLHDRNCPCAKTTADWLFASGTGMDEVEWRQSITSYYLAQENNKKDQEQSNNHTNNKDLLIIYPNEKNSTGKKKTLGEIFQHRLFAVSRRTLQDDLYVLKNRGLIKSIQKGYQLVNKLPNLDFFNQSKKITTFNLQELTFSNVNLETTIENFSEPLGGYRRFYLEVDYIIPDCRDDVDDCQNFLKEVWAESPNAPINFTYKSAKLSRSIKLIVYPVCIYYARRAIYLYGYGETPENQGEWYNYRLDRIFEYKKLSWSDTNIPSILLKKFPHKLPTPEYIREQLSQAWGYDFYEQRRLLILRFQRDFHDLYIKDSFRHEKFENITYEEVEEIIEKQSISEKLILRKLIKKRLPEDAYYKVYYRNKDVNIIHRLRSWRPNGEVLLPLDLRGKLAQEAIQEARFYQD
jgi:CRISPR-associated protein (TIGR03985 family)